MYNTINRFSNKNSNINIAIEKKIIKQNIFNQHQNTSFYPCNRNINIIPNNPLNTKTTINNTNNNKALVSYQQCNIFKTSIDNSSDQKKSKFMYLKKCTPNTSQLYNDNATINIENQRKKKYVTLPNANLLIKNPTKKIKNCIEIENTSQLIEKKLLEYRISAKVVKVISGPVISRFELNLSAGIKSSKIYNLSLDLARSLSVNFVRVIRVIPGTPYVGLEIPNTTRELVYLKDIINSKKFQSIRSPLALILGKDISGQPVIEDLRSMPHLLIAGTTGSGKSSGINAMIISMLYKATPKEVRFIMIDPKILELSIYSNIPHLLKDVITNINDVESALQWCVQEMDQRYQLMSLVGVRNLENYNNYVDQQFVFKNKTNDNIKLQLTKLPYIVIIIDELSDLMMTTEKKIEMLITRLTQKSRAAGIHLILSTQRPSVNVITGLIKSNVPARLAFTVSSKIDSHTILGQSGAESLLGKGDMLYLPANCSTLMRVHGTYVQDQEINTVVNFWKNKKI